MSPERVDGGRVGDDHSVQEEAVCPLHPLDQHPHLGLLERERVPLRQLRHEREHGQLRVAVEEDVLDELLGGKAVDRLALAARPVREARQDLLPVPPGIAAPAPSRIDHVRLHVEDELVAGKHALGRRRLERRLLGQPEHAAGIATRRQGLAQGQECGGRSAERLQERPPAGSHPACMLANPDTRLLVRPPHDFAQGHGPELAITRRVDLDWKDALVPATGRHDIASLSHRPLAADVRNQVLACPPANRDRGRFTCSERVDVSPSGTIDPLQPRQYQPLIRPAAQDRLDDVWRQQRQPIRLT